MPRPRAVAATLAALAASWLLPPPVSAAAGGGITAADGVLFEGCHSYPYSYAVNPATPEWYLETFLFGPDGQPLSAGLFLSDADPTNGSSAFGICSRATGRGTFRIEARLTTTSGTTQTTDVLSAVSFTLGLPGSASALAVDDARPRRGDRLELTLTSMRQAPDGMEPNALATVVLQRRTSTGWRRFRGGLVETDARGLANVRITWPGGRERYRAVTRPDADEYAGSRSPAVTVRSP